MEDKSDVFKRVHSAWKKTLDVHNKVLLALGLGLIFLSLIFVIIGAINVPTYKDQSLTKEMNQINASMTATLNANTNALNSTPHSEMGETTFALPDLPYWSGTATINCSVYGSTIVQDSPLNLNVTIIIDNSYFLDWDIVGAGFQITPTNAIQVMELWGYPTPTYEPISTTMQSIMVATWKTDDVRTNTWEDQGIFIFQDSGPISLRVIGYVIPTSNASETYLETNPTAEVINATVTIPNISIESAQTIQQQTWQQQMLAQSKLQGLENEKSSDQQQITSDWDFSLTMFILFFASFDIAIAVLDYSKDDDRKAEYKNRKAEEEYKQNRKPIVYVI